MSVQSGLDSSSYSSTTTTLSTVSLPDSLVSSSMSQSPFTFAAVAAPRHASASAPAHVSKTYRQASTLFLTRRLPEALTTLTPLITPPSPPSPPSSSPRDQCQSPSSLPDEPAPVATASRNTRVKVWNLYLTILNAVLELEPDEGKDAFGVQRWRDLCAKTRDGTVWEEVVKHGYHGVEGNVDSDVVVNLATLLLAHAKDQQVNQRRLEAYLASANAPPLDLSQHPISQSQQSLPDDESSTRVTTHRRRPSGANTPRDLNARVKVLELYTLHILLHNNEWEYAREFISASSVLDEERREAFLQALQSLHEQHLEELATHEREAQARRDEIIRKDKEIRERRARAEEAAARENREQGWEELKERGGDSIRKAGRASAGSDPAIVRAARTARSTSAASTVTRRSSPGLGTRAGQVLWNLTAIVNQLGASLVGNPVMLTRLLAFIMGLILMLSNQTIRLRLRKILAVAWVKLKATAGMGVKVSYI